jgi:hypothetical protein
MKQFLAFMAFLSLMVSCEMENSLLPTVSKDITTQYLLNGNLVAYVQNTQIFRYTGRPGIITVQIGNSDLSKYEQCFVLNIASGQTQGTTVSSAIIKLDGIEILNTSDFSKNMGKYSFEICNLSPTSALTVDVRGEPGTYVNIWIEGKLKLVIPTDGLVAYYPFNGNVNDESGNGYDGVSSGTALGNDRFGNSNKACSFNGISSKIDIPNSANIILTRNFTLSLWEKTNQFYASNLQANLFFYKGQDRTPGFFGVVVQDFDGIPGFPAHKFIFAERFKEQVPGIRVPCTWVFSNTISNLDTWYNLVCVSDENSCKLYVNGVLESTVITAGMTFEPSSENAAIGYHPYIGPPYEYYHNGLIDDIRLYNRALSESDIQALYHEGGW